MKEQTPAISETLVAEADRLGHFDLKRPGLFALENRIAARRATRKLVSRSLIHPRPPRPAPPDGSGRFCIDGHITDPTQPANRPVAVGQILINLVDNACKYGRSDIDVTADSKPTAELKFASASRAGHSRRARGKLFQAF